MAEYIVRLEKRIARPADIVAAQFMDLHHHARGGVHPDIAYRVLEHEPRRVRFRQETRLLGMKQVDVVDAVLREDGSVEYHFIEGMNRGSRIHFAFVTNGNATCVDATAYLQLSGWKRLIARPFMSAFRKIANKALEEDRIDLESCGYPVAA